MGQCCVSAIRKRAKRGRIAMTAPVTIQLRRSLLLVVAFAASCAATAAEVSVLAAGAAKALLHSIEADFTDVSGDRRQAHFDTVGAQRERVERGERPDVVILSQAAIAQLAKLDLIDRDSIRDIGDVQVGPEPPGRARPGSRERCPAHGPRRPPPPPCCRGPL